MRKYKLVEFYFDLEIEKTTRRLRKQHRNLKAIADKDDLQDMRNLNPQGEIKPINAQRGQKGDNGQNIHGQLENNNIIFMEHDGEEPLRIMQC